MNLIQIKHIIKWKSVCDTVPRIVLFILDKRMALYAAFARACVFLRRCFVETDRLD